MLLITPKIWFKRMGKLWFYLLLCCLPFGALAQDEDEGVVDTTFVDSASTMIAPPVEAADAEKIETHTTAPALREVPDSVVNSMKKEEPFEYANDPAYWEKEKEAEKKASNESRTYRKGFWDYFYDFFQNNNVRTAIYIILGVALVLLIYRIVVVNNLFLSNGRRKTAEEAGVEMAEIEDTNLDQKIRAAIQA